MQTLPAPGRRAGTQQHHTDQATFSLASRFTVLWRAGQGALRVHPGYRNITTFVFQAGFKDSFQRAVGLGKWQQKVCPTAVAF